MTHTLYPAVLLPQGIAAQISAISGTTARKLLTSSSTLDLTSPSVLSAVITAASVSSSGQGALQPSAEQLSAAAATLSEMNSLAAASASPLVISPFLMLLPWVFRLLKHFHSQIK